MALTVEDGTIVAGANTYIDADALEAYALLRDVDLPAEKAALEVLLIKAMDYLEALAAKYRGSIVSVDQPLQWPRQGVFLFGYEVETNVIPQRLKDAQAELAIQAVSGDLQVTKTNAESDVKSIGVFQGIDVEFHDPQSLSSAEGATYSKVYGKLRPLLKPRGSRAIR